MAIPEYAQVLHCTERVGSTAVTGLAAGDRAAIAAIAAIAANTRDVSGRGVTG